MDLHLPYPKFITHTSPSDQVREFGSIHLWLMNLDENPLMLPDTGRICSPEERRRARRLRSDVERRRFINRCIYLRFILGLLTSSLPGHLKFTRNPWGKPHLVVDRSGDRRLRGLRFSISHSENIFALAVAFGHRIGVDIEVIHPEPDIQSLLLLLARSSGIHRFGPAPYPFGIASFYLLWTQNEALGKATGRGIVDPRSPAETDDARWGVYSFRFETDQKDIVGALAVESGIDFSETSSCRDNAA